MKTRKLLLLAFSATFLLPAQAFELNSRQDNKDSHLELATGSKKQPPVLMATGGKKQPPILMATGGKKQPPTYFV